MSPERPRPHARRSGIELEEERAWVGFYQRVGRDPAIAAEVMAQLEADDLVYLDRIADRWIEIATGNRRRARPAFLR